MSEKAIPTHERTGDEDCAVCGFLKAVPARVRAHHFKLWGAEMAGRNVQSAIDALQVTLGEVQGDARMHLREIEFLRSEGAAARDEVAR